MEAQDLYKDVEPIKQMAPDGINIPAQMIDGINILPKIKSLDKRVSDDDSFQDLLTESEKVDFWVLNQKTESTRGTDGIIVSNPSLGGVKTSIEYIPDIFSKKAKEYR